MPTKGFPVLSGKAKSNAEKLRAIEAELDKLDGVVAGVYSARYYFIDAVRKILKPKEQDGS